MRLKQLLWHYAIAVCLSLTTAVFGYTLLADRRNVVNRLDLFPDKADWALGAVMILLAALKLLSLFYGPKWAKKLFLIGITMTWVAIFWAYLNNPTPNSGDVMAAGIAAICYVELWRGDYAG